MGIICGHSKRDCGLQSQGKEARESSSGMPLSFERSPLCSYGMGPFFLTSERSAMANVPSLLARRFYHVGGSVAVPQKCRLAYIGETFLGRVNVCGGMHYASLIS